VDIDGFFTGSFGSSLNTAILWRTGMLGCCTPIETVIFALCRGGQGTHASLMLPTNTRFAFEVFIMAEDIQKTVKEYILREFLPGEDSEELTERTPLITGGILDSIATLKLVAFIEERYAITLAAHEADVEHLDTIASITNLIHSKKTGSA
jgi:acyl carrier protein